MEEWRAVVGYEGKYEVSNEGRVRSLPQVRPCQTTSGHMYTTVLPGRVLTPQPRRLKGRNEVGGHLRVSLSRNAKARKIFIHRLVAQAFIPNPNNYPIVNHKDENPQNNNADNLEWCDYKYNMNYGTCNQKKVAHTDYKKRSLKRNKKVYQYTLNGALVKVWNSRKEAEAAGYTGTAITRCANDKRKKHKGYYWSFSPDKRFFGVTVQGQS